MAWLEREWDPQSCQPWEETPPKSKSGPQEKSMGKLTPWALSHLSGAKAPHTTGVWEPTTSIPVLPATLTSGDNSLPVLPATLTSGSKSLRRQATPVWYVPNIPICHVFLKLRDSVPVAGGRQLVYSCGVSNNFPFLVKLSPTWECEQN